MAAASVAEKANPTNVTKKEIQAFLDSQAKRKAHDRDSRAEQKTEQQLEQVLIDFVLAKSPKARSLDRSGFHLEVLNSDKRPPWKDLFIELAGAAKARQLEQKYEGQGRDKIAVTKI